MTSRWAPREFADGETGQKQYLASVASDTRDILEDMAPKWVDSILDAAGSSVVFKGSFMTDDSKAAIKAGTAIDMDKLSAALQQIAQIESVFDALGKQIAGFAAISEDAKGAIMDLSGGIDALSQNAATYYQNFYTSDEQREFARQQIGAQLGALGLGTIDIDAADARAQYRSLVDQEYAALSDAEAQGLDPTAIEQAIAALLALSGTFASVTASADDAAKAQADLAAQQAADAEKARQDAIKSAYDLFTRAVDRDKDALQAQADSLSDTISQITDSVSMLRQNAGELYGAVDASAQMLAAQGQVYIEQALAGMRAGASLDDYGGLSDAITAARSGVGSSAHYASAFDQQRDQLVLAGQLTDLADLGDAQLSFEQKQLKALNDQIDYLDQLATYADKLVNGTADLTETVGTYFARLMALLDPAADAASAAAQSAAGAASGGLDFSGTQPWQTGTASGASSRYLVPSASTAGIFYSGVSQDEAARLDPVYDAYHALDGTGDMTSLVSLIKDNGLTPDDMAALSGYFVADWRNVFNEYGIPFARGINRIPFNGVPAILHQDEAVLPAQFNPFNPNAQANWGNEDIIAALDEQDQNRKAEAAAFARLTLRTVRVLERMDADGMPPERDDEAVAL